MKTLAIIDLTYKKSLEEIDKHLATHRQFLDRYYAKGIFIASGAKEPRIGGIIFAVAGKEQPLEAVIEQDPLFQAGLAEYCITYFNPTKYNPTFKKFIEGVIPI